MSSDKTKLIIQGKNPLQWLSWRPRWWAKLKKSMDPLLTLGIIGAIVGIGLLARPVGLLQVAGGALLGTALSLISTSVASKQAVRQQFAKEANLVRKTEVYGPLHEEVKRLYDILDGVLAGTEPCPRWIAGAEEEPEKAKYPHRYKPAAFEQWPEFKTNYHIDDFTREARGILDEVLRLATAYNAAIALTHQPSIDLLTLHIAKAIQAETKKDDFQEWKKQFKAGTRMMQPDDNYFQWIENVCTPVIPGSTVGQGVAVDWVERTGALEWLITGHLDQAASCIYEDYRPRMTRPPEHSWIRAIFQDAWPELEGQAHYQETQVALERLLKQVGVAKQKLEDGLLYIRDTYEGGAPPV